MRLPFEKGNGLNSKTAQKHPTENPYVGQWRCDNLIHINSGAISLETYPSR
jgi:hypothetical protein